MEDLDVSALMNLEAVHRIKHTVMLSAHFVYLEDQFALKITEANPEHLQEKWHKGYCDNKTCM